MPPRTRAIRAPKASKENVDNLVKAKAKNTGQATKPARKPLADKTNSASDENSSPEPIKKVIKKSNKPIQKPSSTVPLQVANNKPAVSTVPVAKEENRPRRNRRLPPRYVENEVLNSLSNNKENAVSPAKALNKTPVKSTVNVESPFKTPTTVLDNSLLANRPKRVSRLPSKFDENSSPNKFVPTHCYTSTPLVSKPHENTKDVRKAVVGKQKQVQQEKNKNVPSQITPQRVSPRKGTVQNVAPQNISSEKSTSQKRSQKQTPKKDTPQNTKVPQKNLVQRKLTEVVKNNTNSKLNNKQDRVRRLRKQVEYKEDTLSPKVRSTEEKSTNTEDWNILKANSSFRVFEEKKSKNGDQDIYEFTFDPTEEPAPQKKKKKRVVTKKTTQPRKRFFNNNYEKNIARALADLKNVVKQKPDSQKVTNGPNIVQSGNNIVQPGKNSVQPNNNVVQQASNETAVSAPNPYSILISTVAEIHPDPAQNTSIRSNTSTKHVSYRVEDIAADFDASMDHEINYSPVNSPHRIEPEQETCPTNPEYIRPDDPLNLHNNLSFFDDQPVANSSVNTPKNPTATPWRAEFESLPIKWQADTYVKPDMTPALECSFVNHFDDSKKKHVYTNMITESDDLLPEIEDEAPKLKQTSIISFIKEVVEKKSNRKKRGVSATPTKANSLFDVSNVTSRSVVTPRKDTSGASNNSAENEVSDSNKPQKRKNNVDNNPTPAKLPRKDNENTLFGFDDSENQENVSPVKVTNNRLRSLRSRSGAVLKEINKQTGPMRAELPAAMKVKLAPSSEVVEQIYDQMKSAADAPVLLDKQGDAAVTDVEMADGLEDDNQSVHLFEDIELVHHLKPTRKSYGKAKKVAFQNTSDSPSENEARDQSSDDEDNLEDLSFHLPQVKAKKAPKKKKSKKQMLSMKEKAEADAWAASFNSMCDDIEEFDLVVE
ncbi:nucleolar protein dao-5-like [Leguminivora glycinivorella]|uniref:nucleolar protein dao-5-like n=1 Tax=Leguminivora glycinivorella TaxID=1035111 RepID=UPI00200E3DEA|nr:nucleolar protein dao-5-like [Leguminivora glycinivorella]